MKLSHTSEKTKYTLLLAAVLLIGIAVRVWHFGSLPGGINQDEAFAGYTAYSLLNYGTDTSGYRFPVYLVAWGSGMNALNTYLMLPFIALFGAELWVIRLPQLITAIISLPALYAVVSRLFNRRAALLAAAVLALCPWHIMLSRWGLESNLAPGFLLFGLYFFVLAFEKPGFLLLSALMYGLSLYTYATIWPFVPFMLLLQSIYALRKGRLKADIYLLLSVLILGILALPLLLFLLVNYDIIPEVKLSFISIPRLLYMRSGEVSFSRIPENAANLFRLLLTQNDSLPWNSTKYGLIYFVSLPFSLIGLIRLIRSAFINRKSFEPSVLVLIQLLFAFLLGLLIDVNVNRVNIIFIPLIICTALGIELLCKTINRRVFEAALAVYLVCFCLFSSYYFSGYQDSISYYFAEGLEAAVEEVKDCDGTVYVTSNVFYPSLLFYTEENVRDFIETVEYRNYPAAFLSVRRFDRYVFFTDTPEIEKNAAYILNAHSDLSRFADAGFEISYHDWFAVAK